MSNQLSSLIVSGGVENNGSVVSSYKYVCLLFNVTFTIVYKYSYHNFILPLFYAAFAKKRPGTC